MVGEEVLGSRISIKEETILKGIKQLSAKVTEYKNAISEIVRAVEHLNWRMEAKPILEAEVEELTSVGYTIIKRLEKMQKDLKMAQDTFSAADVKLAAGEKLDKGNSSAKGNKNSDTLKDTVLTAVKLENEIAQVIGAAPETSDAEDRDKAIKEDYNEIKKDLDDLGIGAICSDAKASWEGFKKTSPIVAGIIGAVGDMAAGIGEAVYGIYKTKEEIEASFEKNPIVGLKELAAKATIINSLNPMMPGGSDQDLKLLSEVKKGFVDNVINGDDYQKSKYISSIALLFVPGSGELKALEVGADVTKVKDVTTAIDEVSKGEEFLSEADKGIEGIKDVDGVEKIGELENAAGDNIISLGDVKNEKTLEGISEDESFETGARVVNGEDIANLSSIISSIDAKVAALDKSTEGLEDLKPLEKVDGIEGVSKADKLKISSWEYAPDEELYLKYKDVFDNPKYYNQTTGEINWPGQHGDKNIDGFLNGKFDEVTLKPGEKIDRYGSDYGSFASPEGISYGQRALAPGTDLKPYSVFEVIKPMKVKAGEIAPWFNEPGGGIQYVLPDIIDELLDAGIIRRVK